MLEEVTAGSLLVFYAIHALLSALFSAIPSYFLTLRYKDSWLRLFLLFFFFNMALPVIGYLFTLWLSYYLFHIKYALILKNTKMLNMEELDQEFPRVKRAFGEGSMVELMSNAFAPQELRMKALSAMAENMTQKNVAMIKHSLSDKDDEIRLYSFSLIDHIEHGLNNKIHEASLHFNNAKDEEQKFSAAKELALLYWEMVYFDLSDEVLKNYLIKESFKYAKIAFSKHMNDTSLNVLLGKIYLAKKEYECAETQFVLAIENGLDHEYIIPYLAELYFLRGNYRSIRSMFSTAESLGMNTVMHPVVEQWKMHG